MFQNARRKYFECVHNKDVRNEETDTFNLLYTLHAVHTC
jgi:hypothetical protein